MSLAVSAALITITVLFTNVTTASRIARNAEQLHWSNAALGTAALARAAAGQAALFIDLADRGLASTEAVAVATDELKATTGALEDLALDAPPSIAAELTSLLGALGTEPPDVDRIDMSYRSLAPLLIGRIGDLEESIASSDRVADIASGAIRLLVILIIPAVAILAYRRRASAQLRAAEMRLDSQLEAEREISRAKDRFIAGMSHEMRTPLTGISGFSEVLLDSPLDSMIDREYVGVIYAEAADLARMVDDFIVAARLEDGGLAIERKQVELSGLVGSVAESFRRRGAEVRVSKEQATAECDPGRTRQILVNLLANAHQHGGSHITVEFDGDELTSSIWVRDDGHGVAPDVEPRLFTRFVNDETTVLTAGTMGLGTWVARELARVMGGEVTYERVDGLTSFRVDLPRVHVEAPHAISKGSAQP